MQVKETTFTFEAIAEAKPGDEIDLSRFDIKGMGISDPVHKNPTTPEQRQDIADPIRYGDRHGRRHHRARSGGARERRPRARRGHPSHGEAAATPRHRGAVLGAARAQRTQAGRSDGA